MLPPHIEKQLKELAKKTLPKLYALPETKAMLINGSEKWDRLDVKLMK